jgi:Holliday junction DNA helicase RuvB
MEDNTNIKKESFSVNDKEFEKQLRPLSFDDFKGQQQVIENLIVFVTAAMFCYMVLRV